MVSGSNPSTGAYAYFVHDHLGSVRAVYEASKTLTGDYAYTPYGSIYAQAGATAITDLPAAFTGKPLDPATGLYSFPYRIYSPDLARWLSRDPLGMVDGPNVYGYVHNDPTASRDLSGLDADDGAFSGGCGDLLENCVRNEQERHRTRIKRIDTEYDACRLAAGGLSLGICVVACSAVAVVTNVLAPLTFGACVASCSVAGTWTGGGIACRYDRDKHMSWEEKMHDANVRGCLLGYKMCLWWVAHGVRRWS
jgi:RHS repeat-associated protein